MTVIWIVLCCLAVLVATAALRGRQSRRGGPSDLGSVSDHWVAEHRQAHPQEQQR